VRGTCLICLASTDGERCRASCSVKLFGIPALPRIEMAVTSMPRRARRVATKLSISSVQPKVTIDFNEERSASVEMEPGGRFIL